METKPRKRSSFDLYEYWIRSYRTVVTKRPMGMYHISPQAGKAFNSNVSVFKNRYGLTTDEMKEVISYMVLHDPLHKKVPADYFTITNLRESVPHYLYWRKNNDTLVQEVGVGKALLSTVEARTEADNEIEDWMADIIQSLAA